MSRRAMVSLGAGAVSLVLEQLSGGRGQVLAMDSLSDAVMDLVMMTAVELGDVVSRALCQQ